MPSENSAKNGKQSESMSAPMEATVLNMLPIKEGGGLQNASSFLGSLADSAYDLRKSLALLRGSSPLVEICRRSGIPYLASAGTSNLDRLKLELFRSDIFLRRRACFTLFGPPVVASLGRTVNVVGCAYSNLFYPEIPFWSPLPPLKRVIREGIDVVRRKGLEVADFWIFETETLRRRSVELCGFPEERVSVVRMAPSLLVSKLNVEPNRSAAFSALLPSAFRILYLSGVNPNKRVHLVPRIAKQMMQMGFEDFCFVLTLDEKSSYSKDIRSVSADAGLSWHVVNVGPVAPEDVSNLINACDAMCTLSVLESFSNNFVEAWRMEKPLVVTDADWARDSCENAALYVDPTTIAAAAGFISLAKEPLECKRLVSQGIAQLSKFHTPKTKLEAYVRIIERAVELGPMSQESRKTIHWH
jgi:glycosyltransferase involved in cell wall biosynthesis